MEVHNSEDNALLVEDYPRGFRLRTQIRYWIESTKNGDRFVAQTKNPKTGAWCKPKKTTYSDVMVMTRKKDTGHIKYYGWSTAYTNLKSLEIFLDFTKDYKFNDLQKEQIRKGKVIYKVRDHITFEIKEVTDFSEEARLKRKLEEEESMKGIAKIHYYYDKQIKE